MKYFKHHELVRMYGISDKTVRNWIDAARAKKMSLDLYSDATTGKSYIADTTANVRQMTGLVEAGRKYRNHRTHKTLEAKDSFYEYYSPEQISDIVRRLEVDRELPSEYCYFGPGAHYWDAYLQKLYSAGRGNLLTNTIETHAMCLPQLESLLRNYQNVHIINICVGNSMALKDIVLRVYKLNKLRRIALIDISADMLRLSEQNIKNWILDVPVEKYLKNIYYEQISPAVHEGDKSTCNVVFIAAGAIANFRDPSRVLCQLRDSMGTNDLLFLSLKPDTEHSRNFFDFSLQTDELLDPHSGLILKLLNIEESMYDLEQEYGDTQKKRFMKVRLKVDIALKIRTGQHMKEIDLRKGERLLLWRSWQYSDEDVFAILNRCGFNVHGMIRSIDRELTLFINGVRKTRE